MRPGHEVSLMGSDARVGFGREGASAPFTMPWLEKQLGSYMNQLTRAKYLLLLICIQV